MNGPSTYRTSGWPLATPRHGPRPPTPVRQTLGAVARQLTERLGLHRREPARHTRPLPSPTARPEQAGCPC